MDEDVLIHVLACMLHCNATCQVGKEISFWKVQPTPHVLQVHVHPVHLVRDNVTTVLEESECTCTRTCVHHVHCKYMYTTYMYMHMEWEVALSPVVILIQGTKDACASDCFAQCNVCCIRDM